MFLWFVFVSLGNNALPFSEALTNHHTRERDTADISNNARSKWALIDMHRMQERATWTDVHAWGALTILH